MTTSAPSHILVKIGFGVSCLLLILLSIQPSASTLFFTWPWVFYGQLLLLAPIFILGWELLHRPAAWRREWTFLAAMALTIVISVLFSQRPRFSLEPALFLLSGLAWSGLVAVQLAETSQPAAPSVTPRHWMRFAGLMFFLPLQAGLFYWINDWLTTVGPSDALPTSLRSLFTYRNLFPFGHWNFTGGFALLALPWFLALVWLERSIWRGVWLACTLVSAIMFFSASSRGAVLGAIAAAAATFVGAACARKISRKQAVWFALFACAMVVGLWYSNPRLRAIVAAPSAMLQPSEGDIQRIAMIQGGWLLVQQRPWIGHGPGMTPFAYPTVRAQLVGGVETSFQLHNGPLQLWVDHGLLGLLCAAALAALFLLKAWRWLKSPPSTLRTFGLASAVALIGYFVMFVTDYQLNVLAFVAAIGLESGLVLAAPKKIESHSPHGLPWAGAIVLVGGLVALIVLIPAWRARQSYWEAWTTDSPAECLAQLEKTAQIAPDNPHYLNQLALRRARLAETTANASTAATLRIQARDELARSLVLDSAQEPVHASLGWLWLGENAQQAEVHFRAAIALLPDRDTLHFGLALSLLAQGDRPGAVRELALECLANPFFVASPSWSQEPLATLHEATLARLAQDYTLAIQSPRTPEWRKPQFAYAAAFIRWWLGGQPPSPAELTGALPHQQKFFERLLSVQPQEPNPIPSASWELLEQARLNPPQAETILHSLTAPPNNAAIAGALARLAQHPADIATLLRSPAPRDLGLIRQQITRGHYSIMHNILDGPGYEDLAPRIADAFTQEYAATLFPQRNIAIPGPVMLDLMHQP